MRSIGAATVFALAAHALAWAPGIFLAFGPAYEGESVEPALPGGAPGSSATFSATLVEENGLRVILLLLVPVLLTGSALLALRLPNNRKTMRKALLWAPVVALLGFSLAAIFSIGLFYLPAALALLLAALADFSGQEGKA